MAKVLSANLTGLSAAKKTRWQKVFFPLVRSLDNKYSDKDDPAYIADHTWVTKTHILNYIETWVQKKARQHEEKENTDSFTSEYTDLSMET